MDFLNTTIMRENRREELLRMALLIVPLFLLFIFSNLASQYIFIIIAGVIFSCFFLRDKIWLLVVLAVPALVLGQVIYLPVTTNWVYEMTLSELFLLIAGITFFIDAFLNRKIKEIKFGSLGIMLAAYSILSLLSIFQVINLRLYVFGLKSVIFSFLAYILAANFMNKGYKIRAFLYGLAATSVILSTQVFLKFYEMGWSSRFFFDRNNILIPLGPIATTAAILAFILPLILVLYFKDDSKNKLKPFVFFAFAMGTLAVFLTLGKAAILSLAVAFFYLFLKLRNKRIVFVLAFFLFTILSYILFSSFFNGLFERIGNTLVDTNTKFRMLEYEVSWKIIKNNPWLGIGAGQQLLYFKKMLNFDTSQLVNNYFLQALIDFGIIGVSLVVLITLNLFASVGKIIKSNTGKANAIIIYGFAASLICAFLNGLVEVTFFALPYAIIFWGVVGTFNNTLTPSPSPK